MGFEPVRRCRNSRTKQDSPNFGGRFPLSREHSPAQSITQSRSLGLATSMKARLYLLLIATCCAGNSSAETFAPVSAQALTRLVRQDCGSCHGGLGSPLTADALKGKPAEALTATILYGRPGTTMPAWKSLLTVAQAQWITARLLEGFPEEVR